jgi:hypothetical protein
MWYTRICIHQHFILSGVDICSGCDSPKVSIDFSFRANRFLSGDSLTYYWTVQYFRICNIKTVAVLSVGPHKKKKIFGAILFGLLFSMKFQRRFRLQLYPWTSEPGIVKSKFQHSLTLIVNSVSKFQNLVALSGWALEAFQKLMPLNRNWTG